MGSYFSRDDRGKIFENFVWRQLNDAAGSAPLHFWQAKGGGEVDFVCSPDHPTPFEVKAGKQKIGVVGKSLLAFMTRYRSAHGVIVHWGKEGKTRKGDLTVTYQRIIPKLLRQPV